MSLELITENINHSEIITEAVSDETGKKKWFVEGITLQAEILNGNQRIYPKSVLSRAVNEHVKESLERNRSVGELEHPTTRMGEINPDNISHKFLSIKESGNNYITKSVLLNTPKGRIAQSLAEEGFKFSISSRGLGNIKESNNKKIVNEYKIVTFGDLLVNEPSGPDCFLTSIKEKSEWIYENGLLVEKDLSQEIDEWHTLISESKKSDREAVVKQVLKEFLHSMKIR